MQTLWTNLTYFINLANPSELGNMEVSSAVTRTIKHLSIVCLYFQWKEKIGIDLQPQKDASYLLLFIYHFLYLQHHGLHKYRIG